MKVARRKPVAILEALLSGNSVALRSGDKVFNFLIVDGRTCIKCYDSKGDEILGKYLNVDLHLHEFIKMAENISDVAYVEALEANISRAEENLSDKKYKVFKVCKKFSFGRKIVKVDTAMWCVNCGHNTSKKMGVCKCVFPDSVPCEDSIFGDNHPCR